MWYITKKERGEPWWSWHWCHTCQRVWSRDGWRTDDDICEGDMLEGVIDFLHANAAEMSAT